MSHLRLVPPLPAEDAVPAPWSAFDDPKVALAFFEAASGVCLCRECSKARHPAYGAR